MQLVFSERVKIYLNTLSHDDRQRANTWLDYLRNWEEDPFAKSRSVALNVQGQAMYLFRTTSEIRIFYTVDLKSKTITVIDLTTKDTILAFGSVAAGGS
jgi:mRNA-degrading endonuclease RelE of RelBE toxin-antitoxin system